MEVRSEGNVLVIERSFPASVSAVFEAFSESEKLESWWGPKGWRTENKAFSFREGGMWHYCMTCIDPAQGDFFNQTSWGKAVYKKITANERIVYRDAFSDEEGNVLLDMPEIEITMTFTPQKEGTLVITRSQFDSKEELAQVMAMGITEGVASQYSRLEEFLLQHSSSQKA
ncbi:hypothetical protein A374_01644 [Fictibacillus macauensis ZFHKF-1]|uniref:Activator of Hsp90 ATPase homologue 1/2-like C-terminal domain-containing protein n=1 Tax=Fictibacillus macauensis ZFHKF-1 TaxID=1196324 RepID=I8UJA4_9BACL|nr:hypothetical protein A374_01644 [Fictibacillus macauensis ZFHKF-1]